MNDQYTNSVINKYGDTENVKKDSKTVNDIISRQGTTFLLDLISSWAGDCANRFNMGELDRTTLIKSLTAEFNEALKERL